MQLLSLIQKLSSDNAGPCVTLSMNTHRTHPSNLQDAIQLKNLISEAKDRVLASSDKRSVSSLLEKLDGLTKRVDVNYLLDSLHIFASNDVLEIYRSIWPVSSDAVEISGQFAVRHLLQALNRTEDYLVLVLSQGGVSLYTATNDHIREEVRNGDFPFSENRHYLTFGDKRSDPKQIDAKVNEFINTVDKAVVRVHRETGLNCVVVATDEMHTSLLEMADKPGVYFGHVKINYNQTEPHYIVAQTWKLVRSLQQVRRQEAIDEMKQAVAQGKVLTDLTEIFQAALDGRGDLILLREDYRQAARIVNERSLEILDAANIPGAVDDVTSRIAWNVVRQGGRALFTSNDSLLELGAICLKTRY